jgi:uncharacterized membrane protein
MKTEKMVKIVFAVTLTASLIWVSIIFLSPFLKSKGFFLIDWIYQGFGSLCHQWPSRCFYLFGYPMPVCTRCFGLYLGFFAASLFYPIIKGWTSLSIPGIRTLAAASLPIVIDTAGNFLFAWHTPGEIRFVIGILWGIILPFYFIPGLSGAALMLQKQRNRINAD